MLAKPNSLAHPVCLIPWCRQDMGRSLTKPSMPTWAATETSQSLGDGDPLKKESQASPKMISVSSSCWDLTCRLRGLFSQEYGLPVGETQAQGGIEPLLPRPFPEAGVPNTSPSLESSYLWFIFDTRSSLPKFHQFVTVFIVSNCP